MRPLFTALCFIWIVSGAFHQVSPPKSRESKQQPPNKVNRNPEAHKQDISASPSEQSSPQSNDNKSGRENPDNYQKVVVTTPEKSVDTIERVIGIVGVICTVALTVVGIIGICVAIKTLKALRIQAVIMRRQTSHVARQALSMRRQTTHLKNSVEAVKEGTLIAKTSADAAKASADAASKNIEMFISKERARLRVDLKPLDLSPAKEFYTVDFAVSLHGATPAFIMEAKCSAHEWPINVIEDPELMDRAMVDIGSYDGSFPQALSPNTKPIEALTILFLDSGTKDLMLAEVKADRLFVVIRGFIKYKDVFDRERELRFRYVWKYIFWLTKDSPHRPGNWEKCGPDEQNAET